MSDLYEYRASWSGEDEAWVGQCNGFLLLSHLSSTEGEALSGIRSLVTDIVADLRANGEPMPPPISWGSFDQACADGAAALELSATLGQS